LAGGDGQYQQTEVLERGSAEPLSQSPEERLDFSRDFADGKHAASSSITSCLHKCYRQDQPHLLAWFKTG
jgi:hypothetical protein